MTLAVDVINRRGPSNEMCRQLQPKKTKVTLLSEYITTKDIYLPFITNKTEHTSFKSGCVVRVENGKMRIQLQPKKTKVRLY